MHHGGLRLGRKACKIAQKLRQGFVSKSRIKIYTIN